MTTKIDEFNPQINLILAGLEKLTKNINAIEESKLDSYNAAVFNELKTDSNLLNIAAKAVFKSDLNIVEVPQDAESEKTVDELLKDVEF